MSVTLTFCLSLMVSSGRGQEAGNTSRWLDSIAVNVFVSSGYSYNVNDPATGKNLYHIFDIDDNTFKIDLLELAIRKETVAGGDVGFRIDLTTGSEVPKVTRSAGLAIGDLDFHQMYLSYLAPAGNGIRVDLGKFITAMGYEVIDGYDGYNDNYTRSFLFGYAIPFTHTGLRASYKFNDVWSAMFMVVNGWDNAIDNNMSKSICEQISVTPAAGVNFTATHMIGPEKEDNDSDYRTSFDLAGSWLITDAMTIAFNGDYSGESHSAPDNSTGRWWGVAAYLRLHPARDVSFTVRAEQFDDEYGLRTGVSQRLREVTLTPSFAITPHLIIRGDYRIDHSDSQVFQRENGWSDKQTTISLNVFCLF